MVSATLHRMVRDPRTGEVHMPLEPLSIIRTMENLGRTLVKIRWQSGGESVLLPDDIDAPPLRDLSSIDCADAHDCR
jgi:hypothetical protein